VAIYCGNQVTLLVPGLLRRERERCGVADMGGAAHAPRPEVAQVQVGCGVQLLAFRGDSQGNRLAEEGRDGNPALLWDSTTP